MVSTPARGVMQYSCTVELTADIVTRVVEPPSTKFQLPERSGGDAFGSIQVVKRYMRLEKVSTVGKEFFRVTSSTCTT